MEARRYLYSVSKNYSISMFQSFTADYLTDLKIAVCQKTSIIEK
jgi:hypothetical protein